MAFRHRVICKSRLKRSAAPAEKAWSQSARSELLDGSRTGGGVERSASRSAPSKHTVHRLMAELGVNGPVHGR